MGWVAQLQLRAHVFVRMQERRARGDIKWKWNASDNDREREREMGLGGRASERLIVDTYPRHARKRPRRSLIQRGINFV